jgi:hypothetical protein
MFPAARSYVSNASSVLYLFTFLLNLCLLAWLVASSGQPSDETLFMALELVVTLSLVLEIVLWARNYSTWSLFFSEFANVFDFAVALVCVVSVVVFYMGKTEDKFLTGAWLATGLRLTGTAHVRA